MEPRGNAEALCFSEGVIKRRGDSEAHETLDVEVLSTAPEGGRGEGDLEELLLAFLLFSYFFLSSSSSWRNHRNIIWRGHQEGHEGLPLRRSSSSRVGQRGPWHGSTESGDGGGGGGTPLSTVAPHVCVVEMGSSGVAAAMSHVRATRPGGVALHPPVERGGGIKVEVGHTDNAGGGEEVESE